MHRTVVTDRSHSTFVGLDGMRGVAALVVAAYHADVLLGFTPGSGYLAVDLFFVLSGFVLAHAYDSRFERGMTPLEFMRIRLIRLYPLYLLGLAAVTTAIVADYLIAKHVSWTLHGLLASLALSIGFLPTPPGIAPRESIYPLNTPAWSLAFELVINFAWALTWRHLSNRVLVVIILVAGVALVGVSLLSGSLDVGWTWESLLAGFPRVTCSFALGVLLLRLRRSGALNIQVHPALPVAAVFALLMFEPAEGLRPAYDLTCVAFFFPLLMLAGAQSPPRGKLAVIFGFTGGISYALYALHFPILEVVFAAFTKLTNGHVATVAPWAGMLSMASFLVVAWLADRYWDRPIRSRLTGQSRRPQQSDRSIPVQ
jgi:peptidoglycan/LPS O-acetylase OafA/YrhL